MPRIGRYSFPLFCHTMCIWGQRFRKASARVFCLRGESFIWCYGMLSTLKARPKNGASTATNVCWLMSYCRAWDEVAVPERATGAQGHSLSDMGSKNLYQVANGCRSRFFNAALWLRSLLR